MTCEVTFKVAKREGYKYTPEQKALCKALKRKGVSIIILDFDEEQRLKANLEKYQYTVFTKEETKTGGASTYSKALRLALKEGLKLVLMSLFNRTLGNIKRKRQKILDGRVNSIPWGLPRFETVIPGIEQRNYYLVSANQKVKSETS